GAYNSAMRGLDTEVGGPLPWLASYGIKGYVGFYHYQADGSPQAFGGRGRLEARLTDNLDLNLIVSHDRVFNTTVVFQAAYRFGGRQSRLGAARGDVEARLADRVERQESVTVTRTERFAGQSLALNPVTRQPLTVEHAASYAAPG